MQIPSVRGLYLSRVGAAMGRSFAVQPRQDSFGGLYAQALGSEPSPGAAQEMTITGGPAGASAPAQADAAGLTAPAVPYVSPGRITGAMPLYIPASSLQAYGVDIPYHQDKAEQVVAFAKQFVGTPYVTGGENLKTGVDCSGFVQSVFRHFGIKLPRSSYRQSMVGTKVDPKDLKPGDLLFFKTDDYAPVTHVAMYVGGGKIIHASSKKTGVIISRLKIKDDFVIARRIL